MGIYKKYVDALPEKQKEYIEEYLRQKQAEGYIKSESDLQRIMSSINPDGNPITILNEVEPNSPMGDTKYNELMDTVKVDMESLFAESNVSAYTIGKHEDISKAWVNDMQKSISQLQRRVDEYKRMEGNTGGNNTDGYTAAHNETFAETSNGVYKNCRIQGGSLILNTSSSREYSKANDIQRVTSTPYPQENHGAGVYLSTPKEFDVSANYSTGNRSMLKKGTNYPGYWMSVLLTDSDIESTIDSITYQGYVNVLRVFFTSVKSINTLELDPVSKYKLYVRKIRYRAHGEYSSDESGWTDLTYTDDNDDTVLVHNESYSSMIFRFADTDMSSIEVTLNSPDHDVLRYHFDPHIIRNSLLWDEITDKEYSNMVDRYRSNRYDNSSAGGSTEAGSSTRYMDRTIVDTTHADGLNQMLGTIKSGLNISNNELEGIGSTGNAVVTDTMALAGLGDSLIDVNKNEYIIGAYSITPQRNLYVASGIYESHSDTGYDTYENAIQEVLLESTQHTPGVTSIQYSILLDNGQEYPIVPKDTTTYKERMTAPISAAGTATFNITFYPASTVKLYNLVSGTKTLVGTFTPTIKTVSLTDMEENGVYVVEYTLDKINYKPYRINIPEVLPSGAWLYRELQPIGHKIPLPTAPYISYNKYDWSTEVWDYASGVAGYYSDPHVLAQDITSPMWTWPTNVIGGGTSESVTGLTFVSSDRNSYTVSGVWPNTGWYRFAFTGTSTEFNEYSYMWDVYKVPASGGTVPISGAITLNDTELVATSTGINDNRYEPMELFIDGAKATDKTNYLEKTQDPIDDYADNNEYQYYLFNDTIYTNVNFANVPYKRLAVRYKYLTSYIRLKSVLYTNVKEPHYYTPSIDDYQLSFLGA